MLWKRLQWDAHVKMVVLQHVRHHASGIAPEDVMHCVVTLATMTAPAHARALATEAAKEVADTN